MPLLLRKRRHFSIASAHRLSREGSGMVMSYIWFFILLISVVFALLTGNGSALAAAIPQGAQAGITLGKNDAAASEEVRKGVGKHKDL